MQFWENRIWKFHDFCTGEHQNEMTIIVKEHHMLMFAMGMLQKQITIIDYE